MLPEQALVKLQAFCAYQERCVKEVKDKLKKLKVEPVYFNQIVSSLLKDNFINEERFAKAFVTDKIKFNKWGKNKIKYELLKKQISAAIISKALLVVSDEEYILTLKDLISKKNKELSQPLSLKDKQKLFNHMLSKGFESELIYKFIDLYSD